MYMNNFVTYIRHEKFPGQGDGVRLGPRCIVLSLSSKRPNIPTKSPRDGWKETISLHGTPPS